MKAFTQPLEAFSGPLRSSLGKGITELSGVTNSACAHLTYALFPEQTTRVIVAPDEIRAHEVASDYRIFDRETFYFPPKDFLFYQSDLNGSLLARERMRCFKALHDGVNITVITTIDAFLERYTAPGRVSSGTLVVKCGASLEPDSFAQKLTEMGYERTSEVGAEGEFSIRGGIIDIFPLTEENPVRIELFGDDIESIRYFSVSSQRSIEPVTEVELFPDSDLGAGDTPFWDYFDPENTIFFLLSPARLIERADQACKEFAEGMKGRSEEDHELLFTSNEVFEHLKELFCISLSEINLPQNLFVPVASFEIDSRQIGSYNNSFAGLESDLKRYRKEKYALLILCGSHTRAKRLSSDLTDDGITAFYTEDYDRVPAPGEIMLVYGNISRGFEYPSLRFAVISETDIFGGSFRKRKKKHTVYEGEKISSFSELKVGDYVVHEDYGMGIYSGIVHREIDGITRDYVKISYIDNASVYVIASNLKSLQKYASADTEKRPKLNRLGSREWSRTKDKVRKAVESIARDLVALYSLRSMETGFAYGPDTVWQREFEELFPYEETDDQLSAIEAVKADMQSTKIMDRLICGDVGFGKTEIAIRAAFKAVQEGKQVAFLTPTTILASQHYKTFSERMVNYPVRVDLLCRFRTTGQQKKTIEDLKKGQVDIVIGTHRLLSNDVAFKDLGLLVIDEEQRFGVTHKEKIKKLRRNVDVIALTATPIPRTLHMSLVGIRDMSVLSEPPEDRLPIQTFIMEYSDEIVREAIARELSRGGQVYYVYNVVNNISDIAAHLSELCPHARIAFAHGQMAERELEDIMSDFIEGDIDVLVSTTIIETGLDIPNVNTMIIHDSDKMGLSQLYQLRGRVGRSNRTAYAFLMYRRDRILRETAEKRLNAIREFTDLGSGFRIAMKDLEIRGAGNVLGREQHGHMEAVGYDLYCKMLGSAVRQEKGEALLPEFTTVIDLNEDAYIPDSYVKNENAKLDLYKRIAGIDTEDEAEDMRNELTDRFGKLPGSVDNLIEISLVRSLAHEVYVENLTASGNTIQLALFPQALLDPTRIQDLLNEYEGALTFRASAHPLLIYKIPGDLKTPDLIACSKALLTSMRILLENDMD
ncbi:MAG: transcription-repair coupling factor [Lachnospiraceae bacterium]|nr:transcription-repair coupling factor [Lachnospiraceae bacterium]